MLTWCSVIYQVSIHVVSIAAGRTTCVRAPRCATLFRPPPGGLVRSTCAAPAHHKGYVVWHRRRSRVAPSQMSEAAELPNRRLPKIGSADSTGSGGGGMIPSASTAAVMQLAGDAQAADFDDAFSLVHTIADILFCCSVGNLKKLKAIVAESGIDLAGDQVRARPRRRLGPRVTHAPRAGKPADVTALAPLFRPCDPLATWSRPWGC